MSADVVYLDTSAVVKLVVREPQTAALQHFLRSRARRVSTALLRVELLRVAGRVPAPGIRERALRQLANIHLIRLDPALLDAASGLQPPSLRSLDAIHLAGALSLGANLDALVTYDARLMEAANLLGLTVSSPA